MMEMVDYIFRCSLMGVTAILLTAAVTVGPMFLLLAVSECARKRK